MAFYGIRGVGSAYYLAYALNREAFPKPEYLWSVVGLVILLSILMHGATVTPVLRWLDRHTLRWRFPLTGRLHASTTKPTKASDAPAGSPTPGSRRLLQSRYAAV